jgi:hypothetical protein
VQYLIALSRAAMLISFFFLHHPPDSQTNNTRGHAMLIWKVWANDEDLVFEGSEVDARAYVVEHLSEIPDLVLESPDSDSYRYQDGGWVFLGAAGFWGPNGAYRPQHQ